MKKLIWYGYGLDYILRRKNSLYRKLPYSRRRRLTKQAANDVLYSALRSDKEFFAGRIGLFEMAAMRAYEFDNYSKYKIVMQQIYDCAGFFPNDISLGNRFLTLMKESLKETDLLACSKELAENYFINRNTNPQMLTTELFYIMEPWRFQNPWTSALAGKRVLVVSPFEQSIIEQYGKREQLFQGTDILPEFTLLTYKALQTTGDITDDRFATWFEALEYMYQDICKIDFDVALLGCGAYGFPLAATLKRGGKQAIHMGGVLQILFGIMGKRWDGTGPNSKTHQMREDIAPYYNEYWTYPKDSERPASADKVEYGPYWK